MPGDEGGDTRAAPCPTSAQDPEDEVEPRLADRPAVHLPPGSPVAPRTAGDRQLERLELTFGGDVHESLHGELAVRKRVGAKALQRRTAVRVYTNDGAEASVEADAPIALVRSAVKTFRSPWLKSGSPRSMNRSATSTVRTCSTCRCPR